MTLPNGDNFVTGSILSYQQGNRIKNHWHGASAPSSPVAGMIWVDSDNGVAYVYFDGAWTALGGGAGGNLLSNSGFGVSSRCVLTDIDDQIAVSDIAAGVCTSGDTKNLQVGDLVRFNGGGTTGTNTYKVTALTTDTNFTLNDTSITDGTAVNCDEATPAFIAADTYAPDGWSKTSTLDLYRWFNHPTYHKGVYGLQVTKGANGAEYLNAFAPRVSKVGHYLRFRGRTVTFGCWVYSVTAADNVKLQINDSAGTAESSFVAANTLTWVTVTRTCGASITSFTPRILFDGDTSDVAYVSRPMLIFGASISEGNYQPRHHEMIWCEATCNSDALASLGAQGNIAWTTLDLEVDSLGKIPKGAKAVQILTSVRDSGSLGSNPYLILRRDNSQNFQYTNWIAGINNDVYIYNIGFQTLNGETEYQYNVNASGGATFDIDTYDYKAVLLTD